MIKLRIGGVPEHFNLPWRELIDGGVLVRDGIEAEWRDYAAGSGAMVADLDAGALDLAVLLTEGAAAGVGNGAALAILSLYTTSPLTWGVHVPRGSAYAHVDELRGRRFAISREGSGSHLMAFALARQRRWSWGELEFVTVGGLDGAVDAFAAGTADAFLWEKFMTGPIVASGAFRRIADFAAPWPAFVVCASPAALDAHAGALATTIDRALARAATLKVDVGAAARIAARYGLEPRAVADWLEATEWAPRAGIRASDVEPAAELLRACGVIDPSASVPIVGAA